MKERPLQNMRTLAGAIWGASMKNVNGEHINEYRYLLSREEPPTQNPKESELKQIILSQITESLTKGHFNLEDLLTVPWSFRRIRTSRFAAALITFTNDHGKKTTPEFFPTDEVVTYLQNIRQQYENTGEQLTIPDQFSIALSQADNNPIAAALLTHAAYRSIARLWDTRMSPKLKFPVTSNTEAITMINIAKSTADFDDSQEITDPLGNTYHFWSQFTAGVVFTLEKRKRFIQTSLYNQAFSHGPELTSLVRKKIRGRPHSFGNHKEVDMQGLRLGRAAGHLILNKLRK